MNITNTELRQNARQKMSGNYGQVFLAVFVPGLLAAVANFIVGLIIGGVPYLSDLVSLTITSIGAFMTTKMVLNLTRNYRSAGFDQSLTPANSIGNYVLYSLLFGLFTLLLHVPVDLYFFDTYYATADSINEVIDPLLMSNDPEVVFEALGIIYSYIGVIFLISIVLSILLMKLYFTTYIIVDDNLSFIEAIKKSWNLTKGNITRIIGMSLFFIGWYVLSIFTFGLLLLWVIPYQQISITNLFLYLKEQQGEEINFNTRTQTEHTINKPQSDWIDEEKQENDWDF